MSDWSEPDERGVRTRVLYLKPKRRVSGERRRAASRIADAGQVVLDEGHRSLLKELLRRFRSSWRWDRILAVAGDQRVEIAYSLISTLLEAGYVEAIERRDARGWQPIRVVPTASRELHRLARIADPGDTAAALANALEYRARAEITHQLQTRLGTGRLDIRLRRALLLPHLDRWLEEEKTGTRRDFALFAAGHTKGIEDADWRWLEMHGALEPAGIIEHIPLLLVGGAFSVFDSAQRTLNIAAANGPVGLPAAAVRYAVRAIPPAVWVIVENRTVFDKACALASNAGLLWVPGHAAIWWLEAVNMLLERAPGNAVIACDPDPAGIEIARGLARVWERRGLRWRLAGMDAAAHAALPARRPLSPWDRETLARMQDLPATLDELRRVLIHSNTKGEQEGYFNEARLLDLLKRVDRWDDGEFLAIGD